MIYFKYIAILSFLAACNKQVKVNQSSKEHSQNELQIFSNDTLLNLYQLSLILPKGWRMANDDTLPKLLDATA
jgi:hypothetical protein